MTVATAPAARKSRKRAAVPSQAAPRVSHLRPLQALALPLGFTLVLLAFALLPFVHQNSRLLWSFLGAGGALLAWNAALLASARRDGRILVLEVALRKQHYLQACAQGSVLLYWGWYWREVYDAAPLIVAQLLFAYAFDMLLSWSRRETYTLGFGPFPVIFSINLFLWFRHDWFYLQFLMIAVGFAAKELIRWNKDGRLAHIFNPSSFPLALFSIALILTGTTNITWGEEIAQTQFRPPNIYLMLFLVGLPGQFFFGVTSMTMSAVVTTYLFGLLYFAATGTYYFFDSYIPIAVFLGMHLLFTDPSTSPRTELGRILFGILYGFSVIGLYWLLNLGGMSTIYDKLLPVPILNLAITLIDRAARSRVLKPFDPAVLGAGLSPRRRNLAYMCVWAVVFFMMSAAEGVGDTHRGQEMTFWEQACQEGRPNACRNLMLMESAHCRDGSGWACNELGIHASDASVPSDRPTAVSFQRACSLGFTPGCENAKMTFTGGELRRAEPPPTEYKILLRSAKGTPGGLTPFELYERACDRGWITGCEGLGFAYMTGQGTPRDPARAALELGKACDAGHADACSNVGLLYRQGDGVARDEARALGYLKKACDLGMSKACAWFESEQQKLGITR